jgi:vacuolar protein sorting-associated protein 41
MAADSEEQEASQEQPVAQSTSHNGDTAGDDPEAESQNTDDEDKEEREEGYEEEPKLKYARLTSHLAPVYRNGDMTSVFLVAGDKMVLPPVHQRSGIRH